MIFTGPVPHPEAVVQHQSVFTNTCSRAPYRGPVADRDLPPRASGRPARARHGHRPARAAAPQRHPARRAAVPHTHRPGARPVSPAETLEQAAGIIGYDEFRRASTGRRSQAGRLLGIGIGLYIEPQAAMGAYGAEPAHIRVQPERQGRRATSGRARTDRASRPRPRSSSSEHLGVALRRRRRCTRATPRRRRTRSAPAAAAAGPILGAAIHSPRRSSATKVAAIAAHRSKRRRSRPRHRRRRASSCAARRRATTVADIARSRTRLAALPAGDGAGPRDRQALHRPTCPSSSRTPATCARSRSTPSPARSRCSATWSAKTAA